MIIRNVPQITDRRSLKPEIGDRVLYEGEEYIVDQVGLRWIYMYLPDDPRKIKKMAKITQIAKKPKGADVQA